jgi:hypothetical protein
MVLLSCVQFKFCNCTVDDLKSVCSVLFYRVSEYCCKCALDHMVFLSCFMLGLECTWWHLRLSLDDQDYSRVRSTSSSIIRQSLRSRCIVSC